MKNFSLPTKAIIFSALATLALASCNTVAVRGSGPIVEQDYGIQDVSEVDVRGNGHLIIQNGATERFIVVAQNDIHDHLNIYQEGDRLIIKPDSGIRFRTDEPIQYILTTNNLTYVGLSGALTVSSVEYTTDSLDVHASGATNIDLSIYCDKLAIDGSGAFDGYLAGQATYFSIKMTGASDLNAFDFATESADIRVSGAGKALVTVSERLTVSVSGASTVGYKGNPIISQSSSGASNIYNAD